MTYVWVGIIVERDQTIPADGQDDLAVSELNDACYFRLGHSRQRLETLTILNVPYLHTTTLVS